MSHEPLPEELRAAVCENLAAALAGVIAPSVHHAAAINTIGCYLLCHLTAADYQVVAGSIVIKQGGTPLALRADPSRIDEHEYYLWIERPNDDGRVELIDFAAPYWMDWARENNALWLGPPPETTWTYVDALDKNIAHYTPEWEITNMVRVALHNAFRSTSPPEQVVQWETVINATVELLAQDPRAIHYLVTNGIAEPASPSKN
jgi:hypothetical protein